MVDLLANQGVISTQNRIVLNWKELPPSRIKMIFHERVEEDRIVFRRRALDTDPK